MSTPGVGGDIDLELPPGYETGLNRSTTFCVTPIGDKKITQDVSAMAAM